MSITSITGKGLTARITTKGQITVPKRVRDALEIEPGDELEFELGTDRAVVRPRRRRVLGDLAGIAGSAAVRIPTTAGALDEAIGQAALRRAKAGTGRSVEG